MADYSELASLERSLRNEMSVLEYELEQILAEGRVCLENWATEERLPEVPDDFRCLLAVISEVLIERGENVVDIRNARWE